MNIWLSHQAHHDDNVICTFLEIYNEIDIAQGPSLKPCRLSITGQHQKL